MSAGGTLHLPLQLPPDARGFVVHVISGPHAGIFGKYATAERALSIAATLRRNGLEVCVLDANHDVIEQREKT